jgi:hypothetical protein
VTQDSQRDNRRKAAWSVKDQRIQESVRALIGRWNIARYTAIGVKQNFVGVPGYRPGARGSPVLLPFGTSHPREYRQVRAAVVGDLRELAGPCRGQKPSGPASNVPLDERETSRWASPRYVVSERHGHLVECAPRASEGAPSSDHLAATRKLTQSG